MQIKTQRLTLHAATQEILRAELAYIRDAGQQLGFERALGTQLLRWPPLYNDESTCTYFLDRLTAFPDKVGWWLWYVLLRDVADKPLLVASAGFHGPPDAASHIEIGYSVIEPYQRQGIATEAVNALTGWAFDHVEVTKVVIIRLDTPEFVPSTKVAMKCGYRFVGSRESDEGTLLVYEITREEFTLGGKSDS